ncbi:MAG: Fic family protein [Actinobacteria bacterium]|nr:Fic family protein [Actinomycetota bacterium]
MRGRLVDCRWSAAPDLYAPVRYRRACDYQAFIPEPLLENIPPLSPSIAGAIAEAEAAMRDLNTTARPALRPLARLLLRTESIASSRIEGLAVDARTLARAEGRAESGRAPGSVVAEILAGIDAMQLAVDEAGRNELTIDQILAIHNALLRHTPHAAIAGRIRTEQNWIGGNDYNPCGADFVPPPPEDIGRLLADLVVFCNDDALPPLMQAALAHAQFETIHPFVDGNGRTGRALVHVILKRRGVTPTYVPPISVVLTHARDSYIQGLTDFRDGHVHRWLKTFANAATRASSLATTYLMQVDQLQTRWRDQIKQTLAPRADAAIWPLIDALPGHPHLTIAGGTSATGRSRPAVAQAIDHLEAVGILHPVTAGRRNRAWEADGLFNLLARFEAGSLSILRPG